MNKLFYLAVMALTAAFLITNKAAYACNKTNSSSVVNISSGVSTNRSKRLKELEEERFIECNQNQKSPMVVRWTLT
jgi:hypothetical protein